MTTLRVEILGNSRIFVCELCGWEEEPSIPRCRKCGTPFNRIRFVCGVQEFMEELGSKEDPDPPKFLFA
jgi:primosomal protein N'